MPPTELSMKRIPLTPMVGFSGSDSNKFFPASPWGDASEAETIREALETANLPSGSTMSVTVGIQVANNPDAPDAAVSLATSRTSDGLSYPGAFVDKTATTGNRQIFRAGYLVKNTGTGDNALRFCWAAGVVEIQKK